MSRDSMPAGVVYKDVPGFPGYLVGDDGSVWSCWRKRGTNRKGTEAYLSGEWKRLAVRADRRTGYVLVGLTCAGKQHTMLLHCLVLRCHVGPCPEGMQACHDPDPTRTNNRLDNLRWDTPKNNHADRKRLGKTNPGDRNGNAKLTALAVLDIRANRGKVRQIDLAAKHGVNQAAISAIQRRQTWTHI